MFIRLINDLEQEARTVAIGRRHPTSNYCDALFDVSRSPLLHATMHFLMCHVRASLDLFEARTCATSLSPRSVSSQSIISFCEHQCSSQHHWSRSPRLFKKKMTTSTPPYIRKKQ
jgi:hypothetical protein